MIIVNKNMRVSILNVMYTNALERTLERINNDHLKVNIVPVSEENIARVLFYGIKKFSTAIDINGKKTLEELEREFYHIDTLVGLVGTITPRMFMNIFPIDKVYKGEKHGCKDYFTTMKYINSIGIDSSIESPDDFLWAYHNDEIGDFVVHQMMLASDIKRSKEGVGILEEWASTNGIQMIELESNKVTTIGGAESDFEILNKE